jgi:hypothetical protein
MICSYIKDKLKKEEKLLGLRWTFFYLLE